MTMLVTPRDQITPLYHWEDMSMESEDYKRGYEQGSNYLSRFQLLSLAVQMGARGADEAIEAARKFAEFTRQEKD